MTEKKSYVLEKARILVVEDDEAVARQVQNHLQRAGHEVHAVHDGKAALAYAAEKRTDLVVLDLRLPDMSGYDVCTELRRIYHPWILPVVMLTGLKEHKDQLRGFKHGADAYSIKPVTASDLVATVGALLSLVEKRG